MNPESPVTSGNSLLHYRILAQLGEGGMGVVYLAEDTRLGRTVALKVLREDLAHDEEWNRRFQREVRAASAISHPGVATLYDLHRDGETLFYTMEYVEGKTLRQVLKEGALPMDHVLYGALQMAETLTQAHKKGIVHRDLKPENVIESDSGYYKILDFGLARFVPEGLGAMAGGSRMETITRDTTQAGKLVGTISYMSPEQAQGTPVDARSDIFAFGSLIHELATGSPPFRRNNAIATFHAIVHEEPQPLREIRPEAPEPLEWIVRRCLAKDPRRRYSSAADLAQDLRALVQGDSSAVRRIYKIEKTTGSAALDWKRWALPGALAAIIMAAFVLALLWLQPGPPVPAPGALQPGGPSVPVVPASQDGRRVIAVAPFANSTGDETVAWLSQGLPEMITTELAGSGNLKVISTQKLNDMLSMAGRGALGDLDEATATEVARFAGAGIVIGGSIFKAGESYRIDAQAFDTNTGEVLVATKVEGADVFQMVDRLTGEIRSGLKLERKREKGGLKEVTTASTEAFQHYTTGLQHYKNLRFQESADSFRSAMIADPSFALAQMRLGMSLYMIGNKDDGRGLMAIASKQAGRMPEKERHLAGVLDAWFDAEDPNAAREQVLAYQVEHPGDMEAAFWQAQATADVEDDPIGSIKDLRKVVAVEPDNLPAVASLSRRMIELGQPQAAEGILLDYRRRYPEAAGRLDEIIQLSRRSLEDAERRVLERERRRLERPASPEPGSGN